MRFKYSIFLPVLNETVSLIKTIDILEKTCKNNIYQYLVVISKSRTILKSKITVLNIKKKYKNKIKIIYQKEAYFGGALKSAINKISTSHFVMMASDLETNPWHVQKLIKKSINNEKSIIVASRWKKNNSFKNYNIAKFACNKIFQVFFSILFKTQIKDLTFGFRVYPSKIIKKIELKEKRHPIILESLLVPLKLGIDILSVSSNWKKRTEGTSSNSFFENFNYFKTAFKILFKKSFLKKNINNI
jgi:hypothetical protein